MLRLILTGCLLLVSAGLAQADYVFTEQGIVVRYSNSGERLFEYGRGYSDIEGDDFFWLGESVDSIAVTEEGFLFADVNNLGLHSLFRFDAATGGLLPSPTLEFPTGDITYDGPLWTPPNIFDPETSCGSQGCSRLLPTIEFPSGRLTTARLQGDLLAHPDGHLYGLGIADVWDDVLLGSWPPAGELADRLPALVRFPLDALGAPSVVSVFPKESILDGDPDFPYFSASLSLRSDDSIQLVGQGGEAYSVDVTGFGGGAQSFVVPASPLASPDPSLRDLIDLAPFDEPSSASEYIWFGQAFEDDQGHILIPRTHETENNGTWSSMASLLEFDAATGQFIRLVFEDQLQEYTGWGSALFIPLPEPGAGILMSFAMLLMGSGTRFARRV